MTGNENREEQVGFNKQEQDSAWADSVVEILD